VTKRSIRDVQTTPENEFEETKDRKRVTKNTYRCNATTRAKVNKDIEDLRGDQERQDSHKVNVDCKKISNSHPLGLGVYIVPKS